MNIGQISGKYVDSRTSWQVCETFSGTMNQIIQFHTEVSFWQATKSKIVQA